MTGFFLLSSAFCIIGLILLLYGMLGINDLRQDRLIRSEYGLQLRQQDVSQSRMPLYIAGIITGVIMQFIPLFF